MHAKFAKQDVCVVHLKNGKHGVIIESAYYDPNYGESDDYVSVKWDDGTIEDEVDLEDLKLDSLEDNFEKLQEEAYKKIQKAVDNAVTELKKANELCEKYRFVLRDDFSTYKLLNEIDNAGWSSSSLSC